MFILFRSLLLMMNLMLFCHLEMVAVEENPSVYVHERVWSQVKDYLMPDNHPMKEKLDQIFSQSRALCDEESMEGAGFIPAQPQHHTQIIVTSHPELKGYIIKAYLDAQEYHSGQPEYYFWIKRARGAQLIQEFIIDHQYEHLFKVPKKWIYLLPDEPSPPSDYLRKMFILVEEDMDLINPQLNQKRWGSQAVTRKLLHALYTITTGLGLFDCAKPDNCPFSVDGKVAFIDTQSYHKTYVKYQKLTPYLAPSMQTYWEQLFKNKEKAKR